MSMTVTPSILAGTRFFLQSMWDRHQIHPLWGQRPYIKGVLCSSSTNVGHHNPPSFGTQHSGTRSFSNWCGTATKSTSLWGLVSLLTHRLVSIPLRGTTRRLAHRPISDSNTICNDPDPPLADIVLFQFSLSGFPSRL